MDVGGANQQNERQALRVERGTAGDISGWLLEVDEIEQNALRVGRGGPLRRGLQT
jgi:hypothetical protein